MSEESKTETKHESKAFSIQDFANDGKVGSVLVKALEEFKALGVGAISLRLGFECDDGRIRTAETYAQASRKCAAAIVADQLKTTADIVNDASQVLDQLDEEDVGILDRAKAALDKKWDEAREAMQREAQESLMALLNLGAEGREAPGVSGPPAGEA